ncbi:Uncharacterised protein [Avibacterium gallinarum]|uniref:Uncharacterized protein n=1 Tax=Avibacterium gallinarum TaxID=755 RepID=A0A379AXH4_AVIGA|nr:Uncharacterised protein [Avibacterium gallinarum]
MAEKSRKICTAWQLFQFTAIWEMAEQLFSDAWVDNGFQFTAIWEMAGMWDRQAVKYHPMFQFTAIWEMAEQLFSDAWIDNGFQFTAIWEMAEKMEIVQKTSEQVSIHGHLGDGRYLIKKQLFSDACFNSRPSGRWPLHCFIVFFVIYLVSIHGHLGDGRKIFRNLVFGY